jgi:hypothetical protein
MLLRYVVCLSGGHVNILAGHRIRHSKQKIVICTRVLFRKITETELFHCTLYRRATRHVLTRVANCIDVDGGIFENVLCSLNCTNFVT